jgi:hypothetical protein
MGLIGGILVPLYGGKFNVLMSPSTAPRLVLQASRPRAALASASRGLRQAAMAGSGANQAGRSARKADPAWRRRAKGLG